MMCLLGSAPHPSKHTLTRARGLEFGDDHEQPRTQHVFNKKDEASRYVQPGDGHGCRCCTCECSQLHCCHCLHNYSCFVMLVRFLRSGGVRDLLTQIPSKTREARRGWGIIPAAVFACSASFARKAHSHHHFPTSLLLALANCCWLT